jgi:hypothetical protein
VPPIGREKLKGLITKEYLSAKMQLKDTLKGHSFCSTTDAWTSCANETYVANTVHLIDKRTWQLHHFVLGLFFKEGTQKAEDVVKYTEAGWRSFGLNYNKLTCIVTDTEATMVAAGRLFIANSKESGGNTSWHGCIDHLLELVTGIAFKDIPGSEGTMAAARALVASFDYSSQAGQSC